MSNKAAASSFDKVRGGKLVFKGGLIPEKLIKKKKKRKSKTLPRSAEDEDAGQPEDGAGQGDKAGAPDDERDTGIGFAPDGRKKTAKYEEMFPVETRKFGYVAPKDVKTREDALDEREKRKADRYCK